LCWFINGTICEGTVQRDWNKKMKMCRDCEVLQPLLNPQGARFSLEGEATVSFGTQSGKK
jgi:hypothetical protein